MHAERPSWLRGPDDPFAQVWGATCRRYHLSNGKGATKATGGPYAGSQVCDLESRIFHGRRICEITGRY